MAKSVKETLAEITPKKGKGRFSKSAFNALVTALVNDTEYAAEIAVVKNKELAEVREVFVSKEFRKFLKRVLEKAGVDKADAAVVLEPSFEIDNVDGLYELMSTSIYEYMNSNNKFDFMPREDFRGGITLRQKEESSSTGRARNPKSGEDLGLWERTTKAHKVLVASSPAPEYLRTRRRVNE